MLILGWVHWILAWVDMLFLLSFLFSQYPAAKIISELPSTHVCKTWAVTSAHWEGPRSSSCTELLFVQNTDTHSRDMIWDQLRGPFWYFGPSSSPCTQFLTFLLVANGATRRLLLSASPWSKHSQNASEVQCCNRKPYSSALNTSGKQCISAGSKSWSSEPTTLTFSYTDTKNWLLGSESLCTSYFLPARTQIRT